MARGKRNQEKPETIEQVADEINVIQHLANAKGEDLLEQARKLQARLQAAFDQAENIGRRGRFKNALNRLKVVIQILEKLG